MNTGKSNGTKEIELNVNSMNSNRSHRIMHTHTLIQKKNIYINLFETNLNGRKGEKYHRDCCFLNETYTLAVMHTARIGWTHSAIHLGIHASAVALITDFNVEICNPSQIFRLRHIFTYADVWRGRDMESKKALSLRVCAREREILYK